MPLWAERRQWKPDGMLRQMRILATCRVLFRHQNQNKSSRKVLLPHMQAETRGKSLPHALYKKYFRIYHTMPLLFPDGSKILSANYFLLFKISLFSFPKYPIAGNVQIRNT